MNLINEIEISYFRSFYKFKLKHFSDLNIIFGKNDTGKSNIIRALNLFFNSNTDPNQEFEFDVDFNAKRKIEASQSDVVRKFVYVKITFNTPPSYKKSLGKLFSIKRQWNISGEGDYTETISKDVPKNKYHIVAMLLNRIRFIYVPAIKDSSIFERLLSDIYETISGSASFRRSLQNFSSDVQSLTSEMFAELPAEVSTDTKISAPTRMDQLFQTLDFETRVAEGEHGVMSLTKARGDGVKARHIPELLRYISKNDEYKFHIWGFEEPENSLDFAAANAEASRFEQISSGDEIQIFITTHSPAFYLLETASTEKYYIRNVNGHGSECLQGKELISFDPLEAIGEGFYLPAVSKSLEELADAEAAFRAAETTVDELKRQIQDLTMPVVLVEGRTDKLILDLAWSNIRNYSMPFVVRCCDTTQADAGSGNAGATRLKIGLMGISSDSPNIVIGIFDNDTAGLNAFKLDRNFRASTAGGHSIKKATNGRAFAAVVPAPEFRSECASIPNLPIEFLFPDDALATVHEGIQLELKQIQASTSIGEKIIRVPLANELRFKQVGQNKAYFAEYIVPTLDQSAFRGFDDVFNLIESIITENS